MVLDKRQIGRTSKDLTVRNVLVFLLPVLLYLLSFIDCSTLVFQELKF